MSTLRQSMSSEAIEELIAQRVADALATYETNQNTKNSNENGNKSGSGSHSDGGSGSRRIVHTTRGCTYKEFLNCQPLNFNNYLIHGSASSQYTWEVSVMVSGFGAFELRVLDIFSVKVDILG
ncbi:hypothetical protein Tco_0679446 [Tanacetum coccineum]|uniref:Uncharacterized protein n=1 Tax=Tanacetum coccineum TaxID=301880 RepID=A0ABQ4XIJ9_9ASTR